MASPGFIASCCVGNQSVLIDNVIPPNHSLLQEKAVSGVGLTIGILSTLGLFIVLYPWRCHQKQKPQRLSQHLQGPNLIHIVYCIIAAGIMGNIGNFVIIFTVKILSIRTGRSEQIVQMQVLHFLPFICIFCSHYLQNQLVQIFKTFTVMV